MDRSHEIDNKYTWLKLAGEGTYGVVYKAKHKVTSKIVAIKRIKLEKKKGESEGVPSTALREICLLKGLHHPSIVELQDVTHTGDKLYLVFEYLDYDLKKYIDLCTSRFSPSLVKSYMKQLLEGVAYLHSQRTLHRDLKPQNLLLNKEGHIKLADFGLSREFSLPTHVYTREVVTLWYRAPELMLGTRIYTPSVDIWSLGCIMGEMIARKALFPGDSEIDQVYRIFKLLGTPTEDTWKGVLQMPFYKGTFPVWIGKDLKEEIQVNEEEEVLLKELLWYNPFERKSAKELLKSDYFSGDVELVAPNLDFLKNDDIGFNDDEK